MSKPLLIADFYYDNLSEAKKEQVNFIGEFPILNVMELMEYEGDEKVLDNFLCMCVLFVCVEIYLYVFVFYPLHFYLCKENDSYICVIEEGVIEEDEN